MISKKNPGTVLIGQAWPEEVRFILRQNLVVYDLLYIENPSLKVFFGFYNKGMIVLNNNKIHPGTARMEYILKVFAHEIAHARQHAVVSPDGSGAVHSWPDTPEGRAYAEAREKDWETFGKVDYDNNPYSSSLLENAAETCAFWWSREQWWNFSSAGGWHEETTKGYQQFEAKAPNRLKWAETWLDKN